MPKIHRITHPDPFIAKKVNFFADTFVYLSAAMGQFEGLTIENHLSLIEKAIVLLETPDSRPHQYLKNYFGHAYLNRDDRFVKEFKANKRLFDLIDDYKRCPRKKLNQWLSNNNNFLSELKKFRNVLRRRIIKLSLREIISFLRCVHEIEVHKDDLIYNTKILISEFLLHGHSKRKMKNVFDKIMSRDLFEFPFPSNVKTEQERTEFMSTRTFDQQFNGIYNLLRINPESHHFLYRVYGLETDDNFSLTIGKVTFFNPSHPKLKHIRETVKKSTMMSDFFDGENLLVASVKTKYYSQDIAELISTREIIRELNFLNQKLKSNGNIEKYSYIITKDFKTYSIDWLQQEKYTSISPNSMRSLRENPVIFLNNVSTNVKSRFAQSEFLYRNAMVTRNIEDYWQYLDAVIPHDDNGKDQIINVVSSVVLTMAREFAKETLDKEIRGSLTIFNFPSELLRMSSQEHLSFQKKLFKKRNISNDLVLNKLEHPFIKSLINAYNEKWNDRHYREVFESYQRVLYDAKIQRDAIVHSGKGDNKSISSLNYSLPWLTSRFRSAMARTLKRKSYASFQEAVEDAKIKAKGLIEEKMS